MERYLTKGFTIGVVHNLKEIMGKEGGKSNDIFAKIANAVGKKNDQIGSSKVSLMRRESQRKSRGSIKHRIKIENELLLQTYDPEKIVEYNRNLEHYSSKSRVAYAKFKVAALKKENETKSSGIKIENEFLLQTNDPEKIIEYNRNLENYTSQSRVAYAKFKVAALKNKNIDETEILSSIQESTHASTAENSILPEVDGSKPAPPLTTDLTIPTQTLEKSTHSPEK
ncbi:unnamed protein product, partial [Meganyctiphanes norvegica]